MIGKKDMNTILMFIIFASIGVILFFSYMVFYEISSAKKACENINESYQFKNFNHLCDGKSFYKYSNGDWDFSRTMSWNESSID